MYGIRNPSIVLSGASNLASLAGQKVVVVGGTSGIGRSLALLAAKNGAQVTVIGRTMRDQTGPNFAFVKADLSSMKEARSVAQSLPKDLDLLAFTNGIVPGDKRAETKEGVEMDLAASALSRFVMLEEMLPTRSKAETRVFNWGFPGSKGTMAKTNLEDFNSEKSYKGGFETAHMNTVALNEALVLHYAAQGTNIYGCNPGLIKTGIRNSMHGGGLRGLLGSLMEAAVEVLNPSADEYAKIMLPVMLAPELPHFRGAMFGQKGAAILPSPELSPEVVRRWLQAAEKLAAKALASSK